MARIVIDHLASIHHIEIDIKRINIFIGEQATGKSTLCKAVCYFRSLKEILLDYYYKLGTGGGDGNSLTKELNGRLRDSFASLFGYSWQIPDNLSMEYYYTDEFSVRVNLINKKEIYIYDISEEINETYIKLFYLRAGTTWIRLNKTRYSICQDWQLLYLVLLF